MDTPKVCLDILLHTRPSTSTYMQLKGGSGFQVIEQSLFTHFVRSKVDIMMAQCTAHAS